MMHRILVALCCVSLFAACSGGGNMASLPAASPPQALPASSAPVAFTVIVPRAATASARSAKPKYVSPSTQSIAISVASAGANATTNTANCAASQCTVNIEAPIGYDSFTISLYDGQNGSGNLLSTGSTSQSVIAGMNNAIGVTFNGVAAKIALQGNPASLPAGSIGTSTITVTGMDADGNIIIAPGGYASAITLAVSNASGTASISPVTIAQPGQTATLSYDGRPASGATITASAPGIATTQLTVAFTGGPTPAPTSSGLPTPTPIPTAAPTPTLAPTTAPTPTAAPTSTPTSTPTPTPTPTATPTATPVPTPVPTATPGSSIVITPSSLNFFAAGSAYNQTFNASESGYAGSFIETDTCNPGSGTIASVSTASASGPSATFTVTPQNAGSCTVTIKDSNGNSAGVTVGVTISQGVIN